MNILMMGTVTSKAKEKMVSWDKHDLIAFKSYYYDAKTHDKKSFIFKKNTYLTDYAKYLIEYLNGQFKENDDE